MSNEDFTEKENMEASRELSDDSLEQVAGGGEGWFQSYLGNPCPKCGNKTIVHEAHMFFCDTCDYAASHL